MLHVKTFLLSSCVALSFHTTGKKLLYPYSLLWEGIGFKYANMHMYFFQESLLSSFMSLPFRISEESRSTTHAFLEGLTSRSFSLISSILHCSINPCFWEGLNVAGNRFYMHMYIHTCFFQEYLWISSIILTLIHSSLRGLQISLGKSLLSSFIASPFRTIGGIDFLASFRLGWLCLLPCNMLLYPSWFLNQGIDLMIVAC